MLSINIRKTQDSVTSQLQGILRAIGLQGRKRLLIGAGNEFISQIKSNFGQPGGKYKETTWPPLSKAYAKRVGSSTPTLKRTGALQNSFQMNSPRANYIEVFTKNKYAAAHLFGSKKQGIPKRNFMPIQFYQPTYSRLLMSAEKDLVIEISKRMNILSGGALPRLSSAINRSLPSYGNPFSGPQASN
jgi:phage gpG-like protein